MHLSATTSEGYSIAVWATIPSAIVNKLTPATALTNGSKGLHNYCTEPVPYTFYLQGSNTQRSKPPRQTKLPVSIALRLLHIPQMRTQPAKKSGA